MLLNKQWSQDRQKVDSTMNFIRNSDSRLVDNRWHTPRLFSRGRDAQFFAGFAVLAIRIAFSIVLCALLFSVATSMAAAEEATPVPRTLQSLSSIRAAAEEYVRANSADNVANNSALLVTATALDARLQLAQCAEALSAFTLNSAPVAARTTVGVRCTAQSTVGDLTGVKPASVKPPGAEWTVYVPVTIESEVEVFVLRNSLPRDAHVAAADLEVQRRRVPGFGSSYISNAALLRNQHLKRAVPTGTVLMADMLTRDLVVKRGQQVLLVFDIGGLAVQAQGLALADGGTADRIRVQNQTSLKVVEGVIESGNLVRVGM